MSAKDGARDPGGHNGHGGARLLAMVACCVPMVVLLVLIGFKVI